MLNKSEKEYKVYKFDYGNKVKMVISYLVEAFENTGMILLTIGLFFAAECLVMDNIPDCFFRTVILYLVLAIAIIIIALIVIIFIPKKVILTEDKIKVRRYCFPLQMPFWDIRGFNDTIYYSDIESCEFQIGSLFGEQKPFFCLNKESLVEIYKKSSIKSYLIPVKDWDDFIYEVRKRAGLQYEEE